MNISEHSVALISVIAGLGLTNLLGNLNRLIRARRKVRWDILQLLWALIALFLVDNYWWGLYQGSVVATEAASAATFLVGLSLPLGGWSLCTTAPARVNSVASSSSATASLMPSCNLNRSWYGRT
jgi:hypothetical protein